MIPSVVRVRLQTSSNNMIAHIGFKPSDAVATRQRKEEGYDGSGLLRLAVRYVFVTIPRSKRVPRDAFHETARMGRRMPRRVGAATLR
jgi:hypothetical protein